MTSSRLVPACRLTVTVVNGTLWKRKPLYAEIIRRARDFGLNEATAFNGFEGFGQDRVIRTTRILSLCDGLPLMIVMVDTEPKIYGFLREIDPLMEIASLVIDRVHQVVVGPLEDAGNQREHS